MIATVARRAARRVAAVACNFEPVGVLTVGTWSVSHPARFPDETVWSGYGIGYGLLPPNQLFTRSCDARLRGVRARGG